jgi:hypothetical protein
MDNSVAPLWNSAESKADKERRKLDKKKSRAHFVVEYDLAYDGGGMSWKGYYRTYLGARIAAFWNLHVSSWGGKALVFSYPKPSLPPTIPPGKRPTPPPPAKGKKFHGR